jgi:hypothetical protein
MNVERDREPEDAEVFSIKRRGSVEDTAEGYQSY